MQNSTQSETESQDKCPSPMTVTINEPVSSSHLINSVSLNLAMDLAYFKNTSAKSHLISLLGSRYNGPLSYNSKRLQLNKELY